MLVVRPFIYFFGRSQSSREGKGGKKQRFSACAIERAEDTSVHPSENQEPEPWNLNMSPGGKENSSDTPSIFGELHFGGR